VSVDAENAGEQDAQSSTRRNHRRGLETRGKILSVAERLFAQRGLDGVSLRDITSEANVDLALINYHFKTKDNLFEAVHAARVDHISAERQRRLRALSEHYSVSDVVSCFLDPFHEKLKADESGGWRNSADILIQVTFLERYRSFRKEHLDDTARLFVDILAGIYPRADRRTLFWSYTFVVGGLVQILSGSDRLRILSDGTCDVRDLDIAFAELHNFCVAGINALATGPIPV
jgi:AcrR family transcriptional regulator